MVVKKLRVHLDAEETMHIKERSWKEKGSEVSKERNSHSISDAVIKENNLPDAQIVHWKEKQDKETINESSTVTAVIQLQLLNIWTR